MEEGEPHPGEPGENMAEKDPLVGSTPPPYRSITPGFPEHEWLRKTLPEGVYPMPTLPDPIPTLYVPFRPFSRVSENLYFLRPAKSDPDIPLPGSLFVGVVAQCWCRWISEPICFCFCFFLQSLNPRCGKSDEELNF